MTTLKAGQRATVQFTGVVEYADEHGATLKAGYHRVVLSAAAGYEVVATLPPVQTKGARVFLANVEAEAEVVMHDEKARAYVVRYDSGVLGVVPDDSDVLPVAADEKVEPVEPIALPAGVATAEEVEF